MEKKGAPDSLAENIIAQRKYTLSKLDRRFVKELLFGSLRWYAKLYWILQKTSNRDLDKVTAQIKTALILGSYQIFYMSKVPDRSAVNESVEYIRYAGQANAVKFVNGILRTISRRAEYFPKPDKNKHPSQYLALQYAHPKWLVDRWSKRFNFERLKIILNANNQQAPNTIRVNSQKVPAHDLLNFKQSILREDKNTVYNKSLATCLVLKDSPNLEIGSQFAEGKYTIQDGSSQLVGHLVQPKEGEYIIDACVGPGGKSGHIVELSKGKAKVTAVDFSLAQINKAKTNLLRLGHDKIEFVCQDFLDFTPTQKPDKILLDAPCSGLGVLRKHPEGKWLKSPRIVHNMARRQQALLKHSLQILKDGGEIIYSVCSFEEEETIKQKEWLEREYKDAVSFPELSTRLPENYKYLLTKENILLILPGNKYSMDGFGAFIIRKNESVSNCRQAK